MLIKTLNIFKIHKIGRKIHTDIKPKNDFVVPSYMQLSKKFYDESNDFIKSFISSMVVHENFITEDEQEVIFDEIGPYLKRMRYEYDHWDNAIHGYRETERLKWNEANAKILDRVRSIAFPEGVNQIKFVHVLDLDEKGYIKPHIDAIRFCGDTIAGLSLLSDSIMRLVHDKRKDLIVDILLRQRSLYVMKSTARYDYTHEILSNDKSIFKENPVKKTRRVSVICRNEPNPADKL